MDKEYRVELDLRCWMFGVAWSSYLIVASLGPISIEVIRNA